MTRFVDIFKNSKKTVIITLCILVVLAIVGVSSVFAAIAIVENNSIGKTTAANLAMVDAGVDPAETTVYQTEFEYENGIFVYEVKFVTNGTEYEYMLKAADGTVIAKESEPADGYWANNQNYNNNNSANSANNANSNQNNANNNNNNNVVADNSAGQNNNQSNNQNNNTQNSSQSSTNSGNQNSNQSANSQYIGQTKAKSIALADAGVASANATMIKCEFDIDDGVAEYEVEFYTSSREYDYTINAKTGAIIGKSSEAFYTGGNNTNTGNNSSSNIGVEKAKAIAVQHAGFSVSDVVFSKVKLDRDDGRYEYEIEFYQGGREYEYKIDSVSGAILEYDID